MWSEILKMRPEELRKAMKRFEEVRKDASNKKSSEGRILPF